MRWNCIEISEKICIDSNVKSFHLWNISIPWPQTTTKSEIFSLSLQCHISTDDTSATSQSMLELNSHFMSVWSSLIDHVVNRWSMEADSNCKWSKSWSRINFNPVICAEWALVMTVREISRNSSSSFRSFRSKNVIALSSPPVAAKNMTASVLAPLCVLEDEGSWIMSKLFIPDWWHGIIECSLKALSCGWDWSFGFGWMISLAFQSNKFPSVAPESRYVFPKTEVFATVRKQWLWL